MLHESPLASPQPGEVAIWWADADACAATTDELLAVLPRADAERAERVVAPDQRRVVAFAHVAVADVLACYGCPGTVDRACAHCGDATHGKPRVPDVAIDFSLSHSGSVVVVAVSSVAHPVGVDVEVHSTRLSNDDIVRRFGGWVAGLVGDRPLQTWCRLEALGKATGHGVFGLRAFEVERGRDGGFTCIDAHGEAWLVGDIATERVRAGALATRASSIHTTYHEWSGA